MGFEFKFLDLPSHPTFIEKNQITVVVINGMMHELFHIQFIATTLLSLTWEVVIILMAIALGWVKSVYSANYLFNYLTTKDI